MTERRRPSFLPTIVVAVACFLVAFEFLAFQLSSGNDPALGSQPLTAERSKRPVVIDRRIITRRIVHLPAREPAGTGALVSSGTAPAVSSSAPAPVAPAPAAAPAPAPPPAVTASS
ncbi:MAG: hypothetical protein ACXWZM_10650 [Solirubrobacterales bacterium]